MIIDRIEGEYAIIECEGGQMVEIPKDQLPETAADGDVLKLVNGVYILDDAETSRRKKEIAQLAENLWAD